MHSAKKKIWQQYKRANRGGGTSEEDFLSGGAPLTKRDLGWALLVVTWPFEGGEKDGP